MNTTPAVSSALRMASSLAAVTRVHWAAGLDAMADSGITFWIM
jgi:hypothetical protein